MRVLECGYVAIEVEELLHTGIALRIGDIVHQISHTLEGCRE